MRGIVAPFVLLGPALGGARFSLQDLFPSRWTGTAAAASVAILAVGAVAAVAVTGGLVSSGPGAAPPPHGTGLSRAVPASPAPSPAATGLTPRTPEAAPVEDPAPPALEYPAEALFTEPDTGVFPGTANVGPWPPVRATGPRGAMGGVPVRSTAAPTSTPTSTAVASPSATATPTPAPARTSAPTATPPTPRTPIVTPTPTVTPAPSPTVTPTEPPREPICPIFFDLCFTI